MGSVVDRTPQDFLHQVRVLLSYKTNLPISSQVVENQDGKTVYAGEPLVNAGGPLVYAGEPLVNAGGPLVCAGGPLALIMDTFCKVHNLSYQIKPSPGNILL